ncbi:unnamed protein product [marine sediment metagenome]|uniref:Uncharacterized protein n=1 Tax=marine sediment metagenome TaxID=412755 RepID=X1JCP1_9ZZZZ
MEIFTEIVTRSENRVITCYVSLADVIPAPLTQIVTIHVLKVIAKDKGVMM